MSKHYFELPDGLIIETDSPDAWRNHTKLSTAEGKRKHREHAKTKLREMLQPGDTVYCVLRHVSASGMSRRIDLYKIAENKPVYLTGYAAAALEWSRHKDGPMIVTGCGMDMGFHAVYSLAATLFRDDESNKGPDGKTRGVGYALEHKWL
jgi:hypothetical protein